MPILTCDNVTLAYDGKPVLQDLTFSVEQGEYLCILGANGAGKSTLLRGLLGLTRPSFGKITCAVKKTEIGYLPQQTPIQREFPATVSEVVRSGCRKDKTKCQTAMELLSISEIAKASYRELSGGQQQRVLLARALCASEKLLFLDEPTSGLDPQTTAELYQIIRRLNASGMTVVMVTHDLVALHDANQVLHLAKHDVFFGSKDDYLQSGHYRAMRGRGEQE